MKLFQPVIQGANRECLSEKGFSLVVVLFFVGLIATIIMMATANQRGAVQRDQARAAGWHLAQVAKAARIYVRDRSLTSADPYHKSHLAAGGIGITLADLRGAGLLPPDFPNTNIFDQTVYIFAANYPVNGAADSETTVANAYVFLNHSDRTENNPVLMQYMMEGAREQGLVANAPAFNNLGANVSDTCRGSPAYALWDTDCLNMAEFTQISGLSDFQPGSVLVPAWRADTHDTRAVMRYPQAENPASATMLTALEMAHAPRHADGSCISFVQVYDYNNSAYIDTDICAVDNDSGSGLANDRRYDMINISSMNVESVIAASQGPNDAAMRYDAGNNQISYNEFDTIADTTQRTHLQTSAYNEVVNISGNLETANNVWATGRMVNPLSSGDFGYVPTVSFIDLGMQPRNVDVYHNVYADNNITVDSQSAIREASVLTLNNDVPGSVPATINGRVDARDIFTQATAITGCAEGDNCGHITTLMNANSSPVSTQDASFFTSVTTTGAARVNNADRGGGVPGLVAYRAQGAGSVAAQDMTIGGTLAINNTANFGGTTIVNDCFGGVNCPDITPDPGDAQIP